MKKIISILLCIAMVISLFTFSVSANPVTFDNEIFVSDSGDDGNSGTIDKPLKTIYAAQSLARTKRGTVVVYFRGGTYTLEKTVNFNSDDKKNTLYKAYDNEKVVFTMGRAYTGFEECTVNGVRAFKKNVGTAACFNILFNEKTTLSRTRYPESGYLYIKKVSNDDNITKQDAVHDQYVGFYADKTKMQSFKNHDDVVVRLLHYWKDEMATISDYNASNGHIKLSRPTSMRAEVNNRFFLENVFEALNNEGEWYLDKAEGILYYVPFEGENASELTLWGAETETMITVDGADGISFENIIFRGNGFNIPHNNRESDFSSQAGYDAIPCISYNNSNNVSIKNCEFRDLAACAVFFGTGVKNSTVDSCIFNNIGAQAVYIRGNNVPVDDRTVTKSITVKNNIIDGYGKVFYNSVGILVIHANSVDILNNEIHDGYYSAISVGWVWGFSYSVTYNNHICDNLIYDIGQGWLSDMGGIYTLGIQDGTVISGNVIHNVAADPEEGGYGGWGIYLDEGSSKILVEKNLVFACGSDSYHLHYGSYNTVRNNIFALSGESQVRINSAFSRNNKGFGSRKSADFYSNVIVSDGGVCTYSHAVNDEAFDDNINLFWDYKLEEKVRMSMDTPENKTLSIEKAEKKGLVNDPVIDSPMFKDIENFDFEFTPYSPICNIFFEEWDYQQAGTLKGSTVGIDTQGGQTAYNANAHTVPYTRAKTPFEPFIALKRLFFIVYGWFIRY